LLPVAIEPAPRQWAAQQLSNMGSTSTLAVVTAGGLGTFGLALVFLQTVFIYDMQGRLAVLEASRDELRGQLHEGARLIRQLEVPPAADKRETSPQRQLQEDSNETCPTAEEVAVSALDATYSVSLALAAFEADKLPGLESSKSEYDIFSSSVLPGLQSSANAFEALAGTLGVTTETAACRCAVCAPQGACALNAAETTCAVAGGDCAFAADGDSGAPGNQPSCTGTHDGTGELCLPWGEELPCSCLNMAPPNCPADDTSEGECPCTVKYETTMILTSSNATKNTGAANRDTVRSWQVNASPSPGARMLRVAIPPQRALGRAKA
jgi:hypothetical protein